jgi:hypothetical protein
MPPNATRSTRNADRACLGPEVAVAVLNKGRTDTEHNKLDGEV